MKWVDLLMILRRVLLVGRPWALSLDEDIYNARDSCTSHATENIGYLIYPLSFNLVEDEASYLFVSVNALIKL